MTKTSSWTNALRLLAVGLMLSLTTGAHALISGGTTCGGFGVVVGDGTTGSPGYVCWQLEATDNAVTSSINPAPQRNDSEDALNYLDTYGGFFGLGPDWVRLVKVDDPPFGTNTASGTTLTTTDNGTGSEGTWEIENAPWQQLALVLKVGSQPDPDARWAAFFIDDATWDGANWGMTGSWQITGTTWAVSHFTVYGVASSSTVSEPATALILSIGLLGLIKLRRAG